MALSSFLLKSPLLFCFCFLVISQLTIKLLLSRSLKIIFLTNAVSSISNSLIFPIPVIIVRITAAFVLSPAPSPLSCRRDDRHRGSHVGRRLAEQLRVPGRLALGLLHLRRPGSPVGRPVVPPRPRPAGTPSENQPGRKELYQEASEYCQARRGRGEGVEWVRCLV